MMQNIPTKFRWDHPHLGRQMQVEQVKLRFSTGREVFGRKFTAENLCSSATVVHDHDGAMVEEYAVS